MTSEREALIEAMTKKLQSKFTKRREYRIVSQIDTTIPCSDETSSLLTTNFVKKIQQTNSTYYSTCNTTQSPFLTTINENTPYKYDVRLQLHSIRNKMFYHDRKVLFDQMTFKSVKDTRKIYKPIPIEKKAIKHSFAVWDVSKHLNDQLHKCYHITQHFEPVKKRLTPFQKNIKKAKWYSGIIKHKQNENDISNKKIKLVLRPATSRNRHVNSSLSINNSLSMMKSFTEKERGNEFNEIKHKTVDINNSYKHKRPRSNLQCYFNNQRLTKFNQIQKSINIINNVNVGN